MSPGTRLALVSAGVCALACSISSRAALADPLDDLAARSDVAVGTLEVDASDGTLLLSDADGAPMLRLSGSLVESMRCPEVATDPAASLELEGTSGQLVHVFRGTARSLVVALTPEGLQLLVWSPDKDCWLARSVFDTVAELRGKTTLLRAELDSLFDDRGEEPSVGPLTVTSDLVDDAAGRERLVIEGDTLRIVLAEGSPLGEPVELVQTDDGMGQPRFEYEIRTGKLDDNQAALYVAALRSDTTQVGLTESFTSTLAVTAAGLMPVVSSRDTGESDFGSQWSRSHQTRIDGDGRVWTLEDSVGMYFPQDTFHALRDGKLCHVEAHGSDATRKLTWTRSDASGANPQEIARLATSTSNHTETPFDCTRPDKALVAAAADLRTALPEPLIGTRWVYEVDRGGSGEAARMQYHVARTVTAASAVGDTVLIELEEVGGPSLATRQLTWTVDARCIKESGLADELLACSPEAVAEARFDRRSGVFRLELDAEGWHPGALIEPGMGPVELDTADAQRGLRWSHSLIGTRLADGTVTDKGDLEPLMCDWDASEKADEGAIELALSGEHPAAARLSVSDGDGGAGMVATLSRADGTVAATVRSDDATLTRAKRWRDPSSGLEHVVLQAEGTTGLEVHTIVLDGDEARPSTLAFAPGDAGEQDFATLMIAGRESCLLRVVRGEDEDSQVADHELTAEGLRRAGSGSLKPQ